MKKTRWLFILWFSVIASAAAAQQVNGIQDSITYVPAAKPSFNIYPLYVCLGVGGAPMGNGFNSDGNPWLDNGSATYANGFDANYSLGPGFEFIVGLDLDPNWSIALNCDTFLFLTPVPAINSLETNFIPTLRFTFDRSWATPYVMAGLGLNVNSDYYPTSYTPNYDFEDEAGSYYVNSNVVRVFNVVASGGAGLLFKSPWDAGFDDIYVQAQYAEVFTQQGNFSYFPLTVGYRFQGPH